MSLDNLPVEWLVSNVGKILNNTNNLRKPVSSKEREKIKGDYPYYGATSQIDSLNSYTHDGEYILMGEDGANLLSRMKDQAFVVKGKFWVNNHAHSLQTSCDMPSNFFKYFLNQIDLKPFITGSAQPKLTRQNLDSIPLTLAPLTEQQEIVRQLDLMLAQVEQIKARLDAIPAILKKFRQSVLENYFNNLSSIQHVVLDDLVLSIDQGWSPKCLNTTANTEQWGVIKTSAIQPLYFNASENKELPNTLKPRETLSLVLGDVLITRAGPRARCGVTCIVDKDYDNLMICDKVYRVRCDTHKLSADYLNLYLNSLTGLSLIEKMKTGSSESGMNLTQSKFKEIEIPLVSLDQQIAFAKDIKKFFQVAKHIEETVQSAQKRVNLLTQSILAKAFSGELTAEWRMQHQDLITGVNSAEALLAKIQSEREASKPVKNTRKKKAV